MIRNRSAVLLERFNGREDIGKSGLYELYFQPLGLNRDEVYECLNEVEFGYDISSGLLRPDDSLSKLSDPVEANNPLEWFWWAGENEFGADGLVEELQIRLRKHGTWDKWTEINTIGELVRAWCGDKPS